jgi:hypothetical protein
LFQAAASIRSDELAHAVLEPLLRQQFLNPPPAIVVSEDEVAGAEDQTEADAAAGQVDTPSALPTAQRALVAWTLGEVLVRLDRLNEAIPYMRLAYQLEKAPARRKLINSKITDVGARLHRQQLNAARQPILHEALEQDRLVRPRLLARAPSVKPLPKGGGRQ